jgi:hypothetical protein
MSLLLLLASCAVSILVKEITSLDFFLEVNRSWIMLVGVLDAPAVGGEGAPDGKSCNIS